MSYWVYYVSCVKRPHTTLFTKYLIHFLIIMEEIGRSFIGEIVKYATYKQLVFCIFYKPQTSTGW